MAKKTTATPSASVKDDLKQRGKSIVRFCTCVHAFQDATYGRSMRVHNVGTTKASCTVCGTEKLK